MWITVQPLGPCSGLCFVLCPLLLPLRCQHKEGSEAEYVMAKGKVKIKKKTKGTSQSAGGRQGKDKGMAQPKTYQLFSLAVVALVVAVGVAPLTAEISACK